MFIGTLPAVTTSATWADAVELTDDETGDAIDISDADAITLQVRDRESLATVLTATLGSGITFATDGTDGVFLFSFTADQMGALCAKTYDVAAIIERDDETVQLVLGTLPVLDGVIT